VSHTSDFRNGHAAMTVLATSPRGVMRSSVTTAFHQESMLGPLPAHICAPLRRCAVHHSWRRQSPLPRRGPRRTDAPAGPSPPQAARVSRRTSKTWNRTDGPGDRFDRGTHLPPVGIASEPDLLPARRTPVTIRLLQAVTFVALACLLSSCQSSGARMVDCVHGYHNAHGSGSRCVPDKP
jgi:hypothetical protein